MSGEEKAWATIFVTICILLAIVTVAIWQAAETRSDNAEVVKIKAAENGCNYKSGKVVCFSVTATTGATE